MEAWLVTLPLSTCKAISLMPLMRHPETLATKNFNAPSALEFCPPFFVSIDQSLNCPRRIDACGSIVDIRRIGLHAVRRMTAIRSSFPPPPRAPYERMPGHARRGSH